jgi:hypothetical protein
MKQIVIGVAAVVALVFGMSWPAFSQHGHGSHGAGHGAAGMKMDQKEVMVEGLKVVFQIMTNAEHKKMLVDMKSKEEPESGTSHNVAVVLIDTASQKEVANATVSMKVVDPKGKSQIKNLKYESSMKSYDGYFNLPEKGKYELLVLIKTGDQKKAAGVYYEVK